MGNDDVDVADPNLGARIRAEAAALTDAHERIVVWTKYLIAFRAGLSVSKDHLRLPSEAATTKKEGFAFDTPANILLEVPADVREAVGIRLLALREAPIAPSSIWQRLWQLTAPDSAVPVDASKIRESLTDRFSPSGVYSTLFHVARRLGVKGALIAAGGALFGILTKSSADAITSRLPAEPAAIRVTTNESFAFAAPDLRANIASLWMSKFMAETLPSLVSRDCYDELLAAERVSPRCIERWRAGLNSLREQQKIERQRLGSIMALLKQCDDAGAGFPEELVDGGADSAFRTTMDTTSMRPTHLVPETCHTARLRAKDYDRLVSDLEKLLDALDQKLGAGERSCRATVQIQNTGYGPWKPLAAHGRWKVGMAEVTTDVDAPIETTLMLGLAPHALIEVRFRIANGTELAGAVLEAPDGSHVTLPGDAKACGPERDASKDGGAD